MKKLYFFLCFTKFAFIVEVFEKIIIAPNP